jgi:hypothetical protein
VEFRTLAVTVSVSRAVAWLDAVAVNAKVDEFPGMLTDAGTVRWAELLLRDADVPANGAAGEMLPVHLACSPGMRDAGEQVTDVTEYVAEEVIFTWTDRCAAPADAVSVAVCTGADEDVVTKKERWLRVHPSVMAGGAVIPVPTVAI